MSITTSELNHYTVIHINFEKLDATNMQEVKETIHPLIEQHNHTILNMENILFLDSSGLSILISILKKVTAKEGATLQLCGLTKQPMELLELTQLHRVFTLIEECSSL